MGVCVLLGLLVWETPGTYIYPLQSGAGHLYRLYIPLAYNWGEMVQMV